MKRTKKLTSAGNESINALIKANKGPITNKQRGTLSRIEHLSTLLDRSRFAQGLGLSYGTNNNDRDLYQALGYKKVLAFQDYYNAYKRNGVAKAVMNKIPEAIWKSNPSISEMDATDSDTGLEKEWRTLAKDLQIYNKLLRLDKLMGLGRYAVLFLGFNDSDNTEVPVSGSNVKLEYVQPYSCESAVITKFETDKNNERFSLPVTYQIQVGGSIEQTTGNTFSITLPVHYSRVIHVAENALEVDYLGTPRLESSYNYIQDIEKIGGGSAEMFWRGARPGYAVKAEKDARLDTADADDMQDQFDEYEHHLRRILTLQGVDVQSLSPQVSSPKEHLDAQFELVSTDTGIPKRILVGSERGALASSQDVNAMNELISQRMTSFAEPVVLRPLIDRLIDYKVLPEPKGKEYSIEWPELSIVGEKEKAEIGKLRTDSLVNYSNSIGADQVMPPDMFLTDVMDVSEDKLVEIEQYNLENPVKEETLPQASDD